MVHISENDNYVANLLWGDDLPQKIKEAKNLSKLLLQLSEATKYNIGSTLNVENQ